MGLQDYFKEYMSRYRGIDAYKDGYEDTQFGQWNYEDGCLLLGVKMMYEVTGDESYRDYAVRFVKPYVDEDGGIHSYVPGEYNLDFIKFR